MAAAITFWAVASHAPILIPYDQGQWLLKHPKLSTMLWTVIGSILATATICLLNSMLVVVARQTLTSQGATLSTIELWNTLYHTSFIFDKNRQGFTAMTILFWSTALYLSTAYTTLLIPTSIIVQETMRGTELDFSAREFWDWYNYVDSKGNLNRTVMGCTWWTYNNSQGEITFPTCPFQGDPVNFLSAGVAAVQNMTSKSSTVDLVGKQFRVSTGGVLPLGQAAFPVFDDTRFERWSPETSYPDFNYTFSQQGLTADVSCREISAAPITNRTLAEYQVSNTAANSRLVKQQFNCSCPEAHRSDTIITSSVASVAVFLCQPDPTIQDFQIYVAPFGGYAVPNQRAGDISFPNLECSLTPLITDSLVQYTSLDQRFAVLESRPLAGSTSSVPNETVDAIRQSYYLAVSSWGNMMIDSLYDTVLTDTTATFAAAMEASLTGIVEFEASNLRLYYAANEAPGRRAVNGTYYVRRVGYGGPPVALAGLLPPLAVVAAAAAAYAVLGARAGGGGGGGDRTSPAPAPLVAVDPMSSTWLVAAGAAGGAAGRLRGLRAGLARPRDARVLALGVGFHPEHGLVNDASGEFGLQELLIAPAERDTSYKGAGGSMASGLEGHETAPY